MQVEIPSELKPFVQAVIDDGRCKSESEVVGEALRLFQEVEKRRGALRRDIEAGINSGDAIPAEEVFRELEEKARAVTHQATGSRE